MEFWKPINSFEELYEVSNKGRVRSIRKASHSYVGRILKPAFDKYYYQVGLSKQNKQYTRRIHKLVAETFLGKRPKNFDIDHIDRNKLNNNIENLRYLSHSLNLQRSLWCINGRKKRLKILKKRQKKEQLLKMAKRDLDSKQYTQREIAIKYNVNEGTVSRWVHKYTSH